MKAENSCAMYISCTTSDHSRFVGADKSQFGSSMVGMGTEVLSRVSQSSFFFNTHVPQDKKRRGTNWAPSRNRSLVIVR